VAIVLAYLYVLPTSHPHVPTRPEAISIGTAQLIDLDAPRAAQQPFVIVGNQPVSIGFIIPVTDPHPPYLCELRDDGGRLVASKTVKTKEEAANPVSFLMPPGKIHKGQYILGIRGDREIHPYDFAVEVQ
jgi:hypothetical protein